MPKAKSSISSNLRQNAKGRRLKSKRDIEGIYVVYLQLANWVVAKLDPGNVRLFCFPSRHLFYYYLLSSM